MQKKYKVYLIFSLVYWALITAGLVLFGLSFDTVPINRYGILRNYYSSTIYEPEYISGLYYVGLGNYFVQIPSSKVYLSNNRLNVTNKDMNVLQLTYDLVYRIKKQTVIEFYKAYTTEYESRIIGIVNSIISNYFIGKTQQESRVGVQAELVAVIQTNFGAKMQSIATYVQLEAFWLNEIDFLARESDYEAAHEDGDAFSEAYEAMQLELLTTSVAVETIRNELEIVKANISLTAQAAMEQEARRVRSQAQYQEALQKLLLSKGSKAAQVFEYYQPPRINLI